MVIAVIAGIDNIDACLVDFPDGASEEQIGEAIEEQAGWSPHYLGLRQRIEISPSAVAGLETIEWPDSPTYAPLTEEQMIAVGINRALVYSTFAKGGPVKVDTITR